MHDKVHLESSLWHVIRRYTQKIGASMQLTPMRLCRRPRSETIRRSQRLHSRLYGALVHGALLMRNVLPRHNDAYLGGRRSWACRQARILAKREISCCDVMTALDHVLERSNQASWEGSREHWPDAAPRLLDRVRHDQHLNPGFGLRASCPISQAESWLFHVRP